MGINIRKNMAITINKLWYCFLDNHKFKLRLYFKHYMSCGFLQYRVDFSHSAAVCDALKRQVNTVVI